MGKSLRHNEKSQVFAICGPNGPVGPDERSVQTVNGVRII